MNSEQSTSERAYAHVREKLLSGSYAAGTRLVTRAIAAEIGSSLNPVREALSRLASEGFVRHVPGAGTVVHQPSLLDIRDLYGVREALESYAASQAAQLITEDELNALVTITEEWRSFAERMGGREDRKLLPEERPEWVSINERFAHTLLAASQNKQLQKTVEDQRLLTLIFQHHLKQKLEITAELAQRIYDDHVVLLRALRLRDPEASRRQAAYLMRVGCEFVLSSFTTRQDAELSGAADFAGESDAADGELPPASDANGD